MDAHTNPNSASLNDPTVLLDTMSLRLFVSQGLAAIAMFDRNMCYMAASHRWMEDYDLEKLNVIGKSHYEIFPEIPERWKEIHHSCLSGEAYSAKADRFERQNGTVQWLNWMVQPWYSATREVNGIVIFSEDVTENKIAEMQLYEEREAFRCLTNIASDYFWELDEQFRFMSISPSIAIHSRLNYLDYIGMTRWELPFVGISDEEWDKHRALLRAHMPFRNFEGGLPNIDGEVRWFLMSGEPIFSENGTFQGYRGVTQDITERKSTELNLIREKERYQEQHEFLIAILENEPECVKVIAPNGNLIQMNPAGLAMLEVSSLDEARDVGLLNFVLPKYRKAFVVLLLE